MAVAGRGGGRWRAGVWAEAEVEHTGVRVWVGGGLGEAHLLVPILFYSD